MNLHPIAVHFPIALLTIYSMMEAFRFRRIMELPWWFYTKAFLVILGTLAANGALLTGEMLVEQAKEDGPLPLIVQKHEQWAKITIGIYSLLAVAYLIVWMERTGVLNRLFPDPLSWFRNIFDRRLFPAARYLTKSYFSVALALLGLAALTITGALGGSMVFGPDTDPAARLIYDLLIGE